MKWEVCAVALPAWHLRRETCSGSVRDTTLLANWIGFESSAVPPLRQQAASLGGRPSFDAHFVL